MFGFFGTIEDIRVRRRRRAPAAPSINQPATRRGRTQLLGDKEAGVSRGYGFVTYATADAAQSAIAWAKQHKPVRVRRPRGRPAGRRGALSAGRRARAAAGFTRAVRRKRTATGNRTATRTTKAPDARARRRDPAADNRCERHASRLTDDDDGGGGGASRCRRCGFGDGGLFGSAS